MKEPMFRRAAVQRAFSSDDLDQALAATASRGWIVLVVAAVVVVAGVAWSVTGRIANKVQGEGILLRSGGVLEIAAPAPGRISEVLVNVGDSVTQGQLVAWMVQPDLDDQLQAARQRLATARDRYGAAIRSDTQQSQLEQRSYDEQLRSLRATAATAQGNVTLLKQRLDAQQKLVDQGLLTQATLLSTRLQFEQKQEEVRQTQTNLAQLDVRHAEATTRQREELRTAERAVRDAEADVARLGRELENKTRVVAPFSGRVLEVVAEAGRVVAGGEALMNVDRETGRTQDLVAVAYVPAVYGKRIRPGMRIHIIPSTVRQEEYGMLVGTVSYVSGFPSTSKGMMRVLKNEKLVQTLSGSGAPYEVHAALVPDTTTTSGYRWSSRDGPPSRLESGTLANAEVTVEEQRPAELVMPALRRWLRL